MWSLSLKISDCTGPWVTETGESETTCQEGPLHLFSVVTSFFYVMSAKDETLVCPYIFLGGAVIFLSSFGYFVTSAL